MYWLYLIPKPKSVAYNLKFCGLKIGMTKATFPITNRSTHLQIKINQEVGLKAYGLTSS